MKRKGGRRRLQQGGLLKGKSHKYGGIPAIIDGDERVELEGGEYIIRESSVKKYGDQAIARLNQGLIDPEEFRKLKQGGSVNGRNNMATRRKPGYRKGGRIRKAHSGGKIHNFIHKWGKMTTGHYKSAPGGDPHPQEQDYGPEHYNQQGEDNNPEFGRIFNPKRRKKRWPAPQLKGGGQTRKAHSGGKIHNFIHKWGKMTTGHYKSGNGGQKYKGNNKHLARSIQESKNAINNNNSSNTLPKDGFQATTPTRIKIYQGKVIKG